MIKHFCDICGKEIRSGEDASWFKVKKEVYCWHESWWERLFVHDKCWKAMCEHISRRTGR